MSSLDEFIMSTAVSIDMKKALTLDQIDNVTTEDMFRVVWQFVSCMSELKEEVESLDYAIAGSGAKPKLCDIAELDVVALVNTGGSEGVYIDWYLYDRKENQRHKVGTLKTLEEGMEAYIKMGKLSGILTWASEYFLCCNF